MAVFSTAIFFALMCTIVLIYFNIRVKFNKKSILQAVSKGGGLFKSYLLKNIF